MTTDAIVVGGGIGGLSTAFALTRAGLSVRVLEQASAFGEVGAGIQLAPNCTRILDDYGLLEEARSLGVVPTAMVMRDAVDATELTRLDLVDLERRYGFPYLVIHRSDLHGLFLRACERLGVDLVTDAHVTAYENTEDGARVTLADGSTHRAPVVIAADGLHSVARSLLIGDEPVSSSYVAYRGTVPVAETGGRPVDLSEVVVYVAPGCHFVHYGLRGGELLNQVAVFESPKAIAGEEDWGTPDELDAAFDKTCAAVREGIPHMWRDKWWRMYDRDPIENWVHGRIALLGDAAHPPLQYMAQGAIMAIEDGWVLSEHVARLRRDQGDVDWDAALGAYQAVRTEHCRRVVTTARAWGELWHLDGPAREQRNALLRARDVHDYTYTDWVYGPTALVPENEPPMFPIVPLDGAEARRRTMNRSMNRSMTVDDGRVTARAARAAEIAALAEREWRLLIGGALVPAEGGATFAVSDPFTQRPVADVPDASPSDVDRAVAAAEAALPGWRATPALRRADLVRRFADLIEQHGEELALLDTIDAGSPISNARFDVEIALGQMRMYAGFALEMKGTTVPASENLHLTVREPVGVVAKIFPYNHPLMFACRMAAPLVAGNPVVAKPPEAAPLSTLRLAELANQVFPPGVVNVVVGDGPAVPDRLVRHPAVRRIGFIGSEPTGRAIQRAAAESGVKQVTLELGGKNAMVVFEDADLEKAASGAVAGMNFTWSGQSCGSNSRLLVHRSLHDRLVDRVVELIAARTVGDPLDEGSEQGTMINRAQFDKSMSYVDVALAEGAVIRTGGGRPEGPEFAGSLFVAPTVLVGVTPDARIAREEVFGPLLSVIAFDTEDEAVAIANGVEYGLTGSVWTRDLDRAVRVARALEAGFVWINGSSQHFLNVPYGGVKGSGVGGKEECLEELLSYTEEKVINIMV